MADLSTSLPQIMPLGGYAGGLMQGQQYVDAQKNQEMNRASALQDYLYNQQANPLKLQKAEADTRYTNALAGRQEQDFDWNKRTEDERYKKFLADSAAGISSAEITAAQADIQKMLWNPDKNIQAKGRQLWEMTTDMLKARAQWEQQAKMAKERAAAGASSGAAPRIPRTVQEAFAYWKYKADNAENEQERAAFQAKADEAEVAWLRQAQFKAQAGQAGNVDVGAAANVPTHAMPAPVPTSQVNQQAAPTKAPTNAAEAQAAGWKLMVDKNGNKAYVGPNNQFFEIK